MVLEYHLNAEDRHYRSVIWKVMSHLHHYDWLQNIYAFQCHKTWHYSEHVFDSDYHIMKHFYYYRRLLFVINKNFELSKKPYINTGCCVFLWWCSLHHNSANTSLIFSMFWNTCWISHDATDQMLIQDNNIPFDFEIWIDL